MKRAIATLIAAALSLLVAPAAAVPRFTLAPVIFSIHTTKPVVFLTIDDGWYRGSSFLTMFRHDRVPASLFLINDAARENYHYFRELQAAGAVIEDHTLSHPDLTTLSLKDQEHQICATAKTYKTRFGRRPTLFRPPYGDYNLDTRRAAAYCSMQAVVYWDVTVNDGRLAYASSDHLRPGDIVLMHFTANIRTDFTAALSAARAAHLRVELLEGFV